MAYTTIDDPSAHFQIKKWTGNAGTNAITLDGNSNMQPDFMWHKEQNDTNNWHQFDSSRGVTKYLASNSTAVEGTFSSYLSSFDSNGFTVGSGDSSMNSNGTAQCSWLWKANGGTTSSNTDGSITSTVQANTDAGFSIVTYTGTGANATIGHGLGAKPAWIITRSRTIVRDWIVRHHRSSTVSYYAWDFNNTGSGLTSGVHWTTTEPTTSVFSVGTASNTNQSTNTFVAYCFAEVKGFSMFGTYRGNNSANGPFVYTGFKPAFLIVKKGGQDWILYDAGREPTNEMYKYLKVGSDAVENATSTSSEIDFMSNGFKLREGNGHTNASGSRYQYYAFAENPFVTSTGIPTTAR